MVRMGTRENLPKNERLRGRERIGELFDGGARAAAGKVAARALPNGLDATRLAAIAGKALGGAVKRNRMRRRLRAAFRIQKDRLPQGWDMALVAKSGLLEATWQDVMRDVMQAAERVARKSSEPSPGPPPRPRSR